jgi:hypothetical protein
MGDVVDLHPDKGAVVTSILIACDCGAESDIEIWYRSDVAQAHCPICGALHDIACSENDLPPAA